MRELEERLRALEQGIYRTGVIVACAAIALGLFLPFLVDTRDIDDAESISLLPAVAAIGESGDGPFSGEATMASAAILALIIVSVIALVAVAMTWAAAGSGQRRIKRVVSIVFGLACAGGWALVLAVSSHTEGDVSPFSPAILALSIGAVGFFLLRAFDRYLEQYE